MATKDKPRQIRSLKLYKLFTVYYKMWLRLILSIKEKYLKFSVFPISRHYYLELDIKILDMIDIIFSEKDKTEMPSFRQEMSVVDIIARWFKLLFSADKVWAKL